MLDLLKDIFAFDPDSPLLFTQFYFWAFFAIIYAGFALLQSRKLLRNIYLLFISLFFYYKTSGLFVLILLFVTISDFLIAHAITWAHKRDKPRSAKAWLILSVVIDLGILCYFKYAYFFTNLFNDLFATNIQVFDIFAYIGNGFSVNGRFAVDAIILPVGISFYIFQVISYTADVYAKRIAPVHNILDFGFYVSFFPQLVAGPIVRASEFIPQIYKPFFLTRKQFGVAIFWIINGLVKKIVLSDYLAVNFIDRVFENPLLFTGFENFMAIFTYSLQVYADFSGYTDIAIGVAMLMGFYLPKNFDSPYKARNPQDFWRRWHMSLSRWLKTYLYIPLGGNREATFGTYFWLLLFAFGIIIMTGNPWIGIGVFACSIIVLGVLFSKRTNKKLVYGNMNSFITMLLGGLWHGASWNFMIWGGLNGVGMIVAKIWEAMSWHLRMGLMLLITVALGLVRHFFPLPIWNLLFIWMAAICAITLIRYIFSFKALSRFTSNKFSAWMGSSWAVLQTFVFITFTRLFFRAGSNLDPATANQKAWETAQNMVHQIGSAWNTSVIPAIMAEYWNIFVLFALGMIIHWLPAKWKQAYRIRFALLPIPVIALICIIAIFVLYQFITADLQAFIYFQF